jgi:uncharacterized membrane protein YhaH (DUF805 family)
MGFGEAVGLFFKNYTNFQGRSRRAEYWWPVLFTFLVGIILQVVAGVLAASGEAGAMIAGLIMLVYVVFILAIIIPSISIGVRRLHDRDMSGWWLLLGLIPFGGIVLLVFFCLEGTRGPNKFGPDPKGLIAGAASAFD